MAFKTFGRRASYLFDGFPGDNHDYILDFAAAVLFAILAALCVVPLLKLKGFNRMTMALLTFSVVLNTGYFAMDFASYTGEIEGINDLTTKGLIVLSDCALQLHWIAYAVMMFAFFRSLDYRFGQPGNTISGYKTKLKAGGALAGVMLLFNAIEFILEMHLYLHGNRSFDVFVKWRRALEGLEVTADVLRVAVTGWLLFCCFGNQVSLTISRRHHMVFMRCIIAPILLIAALFFLIVDAVFYYQRDHNQSVDDLGQLHLGFKVVAVISEWIASFLLILTGIKLVRDPQAGRSSDYLELIGNSGKS